MIELTCVGDGSGQDHHLLFGSADQWLLQLENKTAFMIAITPTPCIILPIQ